MGSHYPVALGTLLLTVLAAFFWALAVFSGGNSLAPDQVSWHRTLQMLLFCLTAFTLLSVATFLPVRRRIGFKLSLGFGLVFLGAWQELLNTLIINQWLVVRWLELVCLPAGLLVATAGLFQLGRSYRLNRLLLKSYRKVERELASLDPLTQLYNRHAFFAICTDLLHNNFSRDKPPRALCFRIDNLSAINRELGFAAGDRVLAQVAKLIVRHTPAQSIRGRMGARRLAVFLPDTSAKEAEKIGEQVASRGKHMILQNQQGQDVPQVVVLAYAVATAQSDDELEPLLRRAGGVSCPTQQDQRTG